MSAQRIKGQEVSISIILDGSLQTRIDTIQSADIEFEMELLEEGYLGETSDRVDSVFKLVSLTLEGHVNSQAYLELADAIVKRAQRRVGGAVRIDVVGSFAFPNGDFPSLLLPDVQFDSIPLSIGGRNEFVSITLTGKSSSYKIIA
jgi:hypothetical protein